MGRFGCGGGKRDSIVVETLRTIKDMWIEIGSSDDSHNNKLLVTESERRQTLQTPNLTALCPSACVLRFQRCSPCLCGSISYSSGLRGRQAVEEPAWVLVMTLMGGALVGVAPLIKLGLTCAAAF